MQTAKNIRKEIIKTLKTSSPMKTEESLNDSKSKNRMSTIGTNTLKGLPTIHGYSSISS